MIRRVGLSFAGVALAMLLVISVAAASQPARGFVTYQVNVTTPKGDHIVIVNETVAPTTKAGYSDLILQLSGTRQNITYSKIVNASENLFPYLPILAGQGLSYSNGTKYSVHVNVTASGTTSVFFKGSQYTLNVYSISAAVSYGGMKFRTNATVEVFPSTLLYSLNAGNSTLGVRAVLQATNLQLTSTTPQTTTATYVGAGLGIGAIAVAGGFLLRRRERRAPTQEEKPLHWVD